MTNTVAGFARLTVEPGKLGGRPCIRGYRFSAQQLLELLATGKTFDEIRADCDFLEIDDMHQVLSYAATLMDHGDPAEVEVAWATEIGRRLEAILDGSQPGLSDAEVIERLGLDKPGSTTSRDTRE